MGPRGRRGATIQAVSLECLVAAAVRVRVLFERLLLVAVMPIKRRNTYNTQHYCYILLGRDSVIAPSFEIGFTYTNARRADEPSISRDRSFVTFKLICGRLVKRRGGALPSGKEEQNFWSCGSFCALAVHGL